MLDPRLQAVADFVPSSANVADIGTDHAYLAIALVQANNKRKIIAADLNSGPCEAARRTVRQAGFHGLIDIRQGDGLSVLRPREVDAVCIAGMGGKLEADIIAAGPQVVSKLKYMVLQPQNGQEYLRQWLYAHAWHIEEERLVKADGRLYQVIKAQPGFMPVPQEAELILGPCLVKEQPEYFHEYVSNTISGWEKIADELAKAGERVTDKINELNRRIKLLEEYLQ